MYYNCTSSDENDTDNYIYDIISYTHFSKKLKNNLLIFKTKWYNFKWDIEFINKESNNLVERPILYYDDFENTLNTKIINFYKNSYKEAYNECINFYLKENIYYYTYSILFKIKYFDFNTLKNNNYSRIEFLQSKIILLKNSIYKLNENRKIDSLIIKEKEKKIKNVKRISKNKDIIISKNKIQNSLLKKKIQNKTEDQEIIINECIVCKNNESKYMFKECKHLCICSDCQKNLLNCPICRIESKSTRVYIC